METDEIWRGFFFLHSLSRSYIKTTFFPPGKLRALFLFAAAAAVVAAVVAAASQILFFSLLQIVRGREMRAGLERADDRNLPSCLVTLDAAGSLVGPALMRRNWTKRESFNSFSLILFIESFFAHLFNSSRRIPCIKAPPASRGCCCCFEAFH